MKKIYKVYKKTVSVVDESPISLFNGIFKNKIGFLLESKERNEGQFSIMGVDPVELISSNDEGILIKRLEKTGKYESSEVRKGNPKDCLRDYMSEFEIEKVDYNLSFLGGFTGSFGYDFAGFVEKLPHRKKDTDTDISPIQLMLILKFIVIDHEAGTLSAVILYEDDKDELALKKEANELIDLARAGANKEGDEDKNECDLDLDGVIVEKSDSLESYTRKVNKIKEYVKKGHIFQTVLSQKWTIKTKKSGFDLYKSLRHTNPSPYLYYYNFGDFEIIGSSPELLVKKIDDTITTCPIAGTRKRGKTKIEDHELEMELLSDEKERAEHVMLVDLARNDMGRVSKIGSVRVSQFMKVQRYSQVMHLVSLVEGRKEKDINPIDLVATFLPAGTLSGAPKIRAMEIIDELEDVNRGLYGGATGFISFDGNVNFCITIRTMIKTGNLVFLQAGAGIVADSIPENEYKECKNKVMALAKTLVKEEDLK